MDQLVFIIAIIALAYMGEKTGVGVYKIIAGVISLVFAITLIHTIMLMIVFLGLALYLIVSVFVS